MIKPSRNRTIQVRSCATVDLTRSSFSVCRDQCIVAIFVVNELLPPNPVLLTAGCDRQVRRIAVVSKNQI